MAYDPYSANNSDSIGSLRKLAYDRNFNGEYGKGEGKPFTVESQIRAREALGKGMTDSEGDYGLRNAIRQRAQGMLAEPATGEQERGLSRALAVARRQQGGVGTYGSSQSNRGMGDVVSSYAQGVQAAEPARLAQLSGIAGGTLAQSLQERGYSLQQANTLAQLLQRQGEVEQGSILGTQQQLGPSDFERALGYALQAGQIAAVAGSSGSGGK